MYNSTTYSYIVTDFYWILIFEVEKNGSNYLTITNNYHWLRNNVIACRDHFKEYADLCFEKFGDRVKYWGTINEPYVFGSYGYKMGLPGDLKNDPLGPYIATHNIILSHAAAAKLYKEKYQVADE